MTDRVLIAGAGPVGLTMALELSRYGVPVRVIDKIAGPSDTSRAVAIWPRTLELFDRSGVTTDLIAVGNRVVAANIFSGKSQIGQIRLNDIVSPFPFALMTPQYETEGVLRRHLKLRDVEPQFSTELTEIQQDLDGVTATMRAADGTETTERFDWLVACDGSHSVVRHRLGLEFQGDTLGLDWTQGDFHLTGMPIPSSELAIFLHPEGALVFFPMAPDRYRIITSLGRSTAVEPVPLDLEAFQKVIDRRGPGGVTLTGTVWTSAFRINERQVGAYRSGRVFLAGDAAHVHSPAGGQGMNTGMQDAINLAWKLALVSRGISTAPELLESYDAERRPTGAEVIRESGKLTKAATIESHALQDVRNVVAHWVLGLPAAQHAVAGLITELAIAYPKSILNGPSGGDRAGSRVSPVAGEPPYGATDTPRFGLHGCGEGAKSLLSQFPTLLEHQLRAPQAVGQLTLVRPDGYLAASVPEGDWREIAAYLALFAAPA
ncbi:2-polyprenyl-6-methoxyphenol hydroxylase [Kaistia soli DSM 19436]|uniref:2-polyprenyl-6-methoxyphenol hydroxylase n=1 Tax=Kaistia soli DSM 19436 TaxID=1122133 RepID=A0A1M5C2D5_9HYPH|nr:FAD-dependent monooxygenase [Kaistia soli]SHF48928.1 2-polyprenyl-6-methoxyphenol hydroxylase [Kaistia soli DSM 19436]